MTRPGAIYCRISDDSEGNALGVKRQEEDCRKLAIRLRVSIAKDALFIDNDVSASTRSRKARPAWDEMVAGVRAGRFKYVLAYSNGRLTRRPRENEDLIDLHRETGVIFSTVVSGEDDLSTADGRMVARIKANVDAAEAERISERLERKHRQKAERGEPVGGTRPFGWLPDRLSLDPAEAPLAQKAVRAYIAGLSLNSIVRDLRDAGIASAKGNPWTPDAMRKYLGNPRLCGWRRLNGEIVRDAKGQPVVGAWRAICSPDDWLAIDSRLKANARTSSQTRPRTLLSGIARCSKCMTALRGMKGEKYKRKDGSRYVQEIYICPPPVNGGCAGIGRNMARLDQFVVEALFAKAETFQIGEPITDEWTGEAELAESQQRKSSLIDKWKAGGITDESYFASLEAIDMRIKELRHERDAVRASKTTADAAPADLRAAWDKNDLNWQREVVKRYLHSVVVHPVPRGTKKWVEGSVELVWRAEG